jgi:hypothetical protein
MFRRQCGIANLRQSETPMEALKETSFKAQDETSKRANDPRWRRVNRVMRLHGYRPNALIETLHMVQDTFGFLEFDGVLSDDVYRSLPELLTRIHKTTRKEEYHASGY